MSADPKILDGIMFVPLLADCEEARRFDGELVGELALVEKDDELTSPWKARKLFDGELQSWRPMRSQAEARAFIVSKVRQ